MSNKIYLDMDGVIANFDKRIIEIFGVPYHDIKTDPWTTIDPMNDFFTNLEKMPDADQLISGLLKLCADHGYTLEILTAMPFNSKRDPSEWAAQKIEWMSRYPGLKFNIGPFAKDKWTHCKGDDFLIDDSKINCIDWFQKGSGRSIVHHNAVNTLTLLELLMAGILKSSRGVYE